MQLAGGLDCVLRRSPTCLSCSYILHQESIVDNCPSKHQGLDGLLVWSHSAVPEISPTPSAPAFPLNLMLCLGKCLRKAAIHASFTISYRLWAQLFAHAEGAIQFLRIHYYKSPQTWLSTVILSCIWCPWYFGRHIKSLAYAESVTRGLTSSSWFCHWSLPSTIDVLTFGHRFSVQLLPMPNHPVTAREQESGVFCLIL